MDQINNSIQKHFSVYIYGKLESVYVWALLPVMGRVAQSGWTVRGSKKNTGGGEIFRTRPDRHWGPPSLLYNGYRVFTGGKADGAWC
jgi:hypothetical protein